jgi:hypothetical protein
MTTHAASRGLLGLALLVLVPGAAYGQASVTGVVRDTSGAILPGVTVEASSPALIEKVRTVVSDSGGQYRIVDLRPGVYTVTFTLTGFNTFKREGLELAGNFTATVNADLRVGSLEETITVTGEAPVVDVQGVTRQRVMTTEIIDAVPSGNYYANLGVLIPGISLGCVAACSGSSADVGGAAGDPHATLLIHGSRYRDQREFIDGFAVVRSTGGQLLTGPNMEAAQEMQIDTSGADGSVSTGGVRINIVPKDGGNIYSGSVFFTGTNEHLQGSNLTQTLKDRGLVAAPKVKRVYDFSPTFGGPLKKDALWFFLSARKQNNVNYVPNTFANVYAGDPTKWFYAPDLTKPTLTNDPLHPAGARFTWQASPRNKFAFSFDFRDRCHCPRVSGVGGISQEAAVNFMFRPDNQWLMFWSSPVTNRLLLQGMVAWLVTGWGNRDSPQGGSGLPPTDRSLIRVVEQNPPASYLGITTYRGVSGLTWTQYPYRNLAFNATYVTGAHAFKTGVNYYWGWIDGNPFEPRPITQYTFNNQVPVSFTVNADPRRVNTRQRAEFGAFIQDKWTIQRLTLSGALRFDFNDRYAPEQTQESAPLFPDRHLTFPETQIARFYGLSPRLGAALDVFGNGKTAIKVTLNRYVNDSALFGSQGNHPAAYYQATAVRAWTDNGNFYPDCDWTNPARQDNRASGGDLCGAFTGANVNFGKAIITTFRDRDVDFGWGKVFYNWEYSTSVQHELFPRVAVDVGYYRRWYGNFTVTDNFAVSASDYGTFSVTVPNDSRLPLAGKTISGFLNINPDKQSVPSDNHVRLASHYGKQYERWHGFDFSSSMRLQGGMLVQGGVSTGKTSQDNCEILAKVPEGGIVNQGGSTGAGLLTIDGPLASPFCHQETPWLTQLKLLGTYTIPRADVQLSATLQNAPGPPLAANYVALNSVVRDSLGRDLAGSAQNITVNIIAPGSLYGDRLNQIDVRVGKIFRFAGTRKITMNIDLFNLLNANAVLLESSTYGAAWRTPIQVRTAGLLMYRRLAIFLVGYVGGGG